MRGMDRLADEQLEHIAKAGHTIAGKLARELLAHRRASQAAPAPSDEPKPMAQFGHGTMVVDTGHHYGTPAVFVGPSQRVGPVGGLVPDDEKMPKDRLIEGEFFLTFPTDDQAKRVADALVNAPAPSDGLREENERLRGELDWIGNHMVMSMALNESDLIRAMRARARAALAKIEQEG